jgi:glycosyltransferase involved in cell wall biosynthesis
MPPKPQLIDMIRTVPEVAVRLWSGGQVFPLENGVRILFENREITVAREIFEEAQKVARILAIRWGGRLLRGIIDVLELRHAAEDAFLENLFHKEDVPSVLFVPSGQTAAAYYRAMIPADLMNEGGRVISNWTAKVDLAKVLRYDVLWIQLITSPVLAEIVRQAKAEGVRIVYDIDDRLDAIPDENQAKTVYGLPAKQAEIAEMLGLADLVTVTTNPLAEHISKRHARPVRVLPNMVTANVAPRRHPPNPDFVRILWAGSATHKRDLAIMGPAMRELLQERQGKVRFTLFGERLPEILADCYKWVDLKKPVDFEDYADDLAEISADFGIVPLERNEFNTGKSGLKGLEYAAAGYPVLCSPAAEYPEMVEAGFPAEIVPDDGWLVALRRMVDRTRAERDAMGKACLDWVSRNRCMGKTRADQWADVVVDLTKNRAKREKPEQKLRLMR